MFINPSAGNGAPLGVTSSSVAKPKGGPALNALQQRTFRLQGPIGLGSRPKPQLIGPVLERLHGSLLDAVRMGFLHSSRPHGRVPKLLSAAADVRFIGHEGDGDSATLLHFEIPRFGQVASELFRQRLLWDDGPQPDETAFELFGAALQDVSAQRKDSNRYDPGLLYRITKYRTLFDRGIDSVDMPDTPAGRRGRLDGDVVRAASDLIAATPAARRVRVTGRVDVMAVTQSVLKLEARPGELVTARWEGSEPIQSLHNLFDHQVVVEGTGIFRPSGSLLRIDADAIAIATGADEFFRKMPVAAGERDYARLARLKPGEPSVYARLRGSLAGDESDEDFEAGLAALR